MYGELCVLAAVGVAGGVFLHFEDQSHKRAQEFGALGYDNFHGYTSATIVSVV